MHVTYNTLYPRHHSLPRVRLPGLGYPKGRTIGGWGASASSSGQVPSRAWTSHSLAAHIHALYLKVLGANPYVFNTRASILNISSASTCAFRERPCKPMYANQHVLGRTGTLRCL